MKVDGRRANTAEAHASRSERLHRAEETRGGHSKAQRNHGNRRHRDDLWAGLHVPGDDRHVTPGTDRPHRLSCSAGRVLCRGTNASPNNQACVRACCEAKRQRQDTLHTPGVRPGLVLRSTRRTTGLKGRPPTRGPREHTGEGLHDRGRRSSQGHERGSYPVKNRCLDFIRMKTSGSSKATFSGCRQETQPPRTRADRPHSRQRPRVQKTTHRSSGEAHGGRRRGMTPGTCKAAVGIEDRRAPA